MIHADLVAVGHAVADDTPGPRMTLRSPFDNLIVDRDRANLLFGFDYKMEIDVPPAKREYGYWVMPILHRDRLIGRADLRLGTAASVSRRWVRSTG